MNLAHLHHDYIQLGSAIAVLTDSNTGAVENVDPYRQRARLEMAIFMANRLISEAEELKTTLPEVHNLGEQVWLTLMNWRGWSQESEWPELKNSQNNFVNSNIW
jgi:hypothetical protein